MNFQSSDHFTLRSDILSNILSTGRLEKWIQLAPPDPVSYSPHEIHTFQKLITIYLMWNIMQKSFILVVTPVCLCDDYKFKYQLHNVYWMKIQSKWGPSWPPGQRETENFRIRGSTSRNEFVFGAAGHGPFWCEARRGHLLDEESESNRTNGEWCPSELCSLRYEIKRTGSLGGFGADPAGSGGSSVLFFTWNPHLSKINSISFYVTKVCLCRLS